MPGPKPPDDAPDFQQQFWRLMTVQRIANITQAADLVGDMSADGLEFLRRLGTDEGAPTLKWLAKADEEKLKKVDAAIQFMDNAQFMGKWTWIGVTVLAAVAGGVLGVYNFFKAAVTK